MLHRSLLVRSSPLRLSSAVTTPVFARSLGTLRLARPAWRALPSYTSSRWSSDAPAFRTENRDDTRAARAPSGTCYIANIPFKVTAEELKDAFAEFGKVESVRLLTSDSGVPRGVGFVQFGSIAEAVNFVEANEADPIFVLDRELHVGHAQGARKPVEPSDTLMIPNLQGTSDAGVRAMFGGHEDAILAVRFHKKVANQLSGTAFIQFHNVNMAAEAMEAFKSQNQKIQVMYARQRQTPTSPYTLVSRLSQTRGR